MPRPRLLDLFCGVGGCGRGYQHAGFYVVGVDHRPQPRYAGDEFHEADALDVLRRLLAGEEWKDYRLNDFVGIHASPPCQLHSPLLVMHNARSDHQELIGPTRDLLALTGMPYVIENVPGAPLQAPILMCGAAFNLRWRQYVLRRHRIFECTFDMMSPGCACGRDPKLGLYGDHARADRRSKRLGDGQLNAVEGLAAGRESMQMQWANWREITQAIPPAFTEHIGRYLMSEVNARAATIEHERTP